MSQQLIEAYLQDRRPSRGGRSRSASRASGGIVAGAGLSSPRTFFENEDASWVLDPGSDYCSRSNPSDELVIQGVGVGIYGRVEPVKQLWVERPQSPIGDPWFGIVGEHLLACYRRKQSCDSPPDIRGSSDEASASDRSLRSAWHQRRFAEVVDTVCCASDSSPHAAPGRNFGRFGDGDPQKLGWEPFFGEESAKSRRRHSHFETAADRVFVGRSRFWNTAGLTNGGDQLVIAKALDG